MVIYIKLIDDLKFIMQFKKNSNNDNKKKIPKSETICKPMRPKSKRYTTHTHKRK